MSYAETTQRSERRRATMTGIPPISPATGASRGRPTIRRSTPCVIASRAPCWPPCSSRPARRCCSPATNSAARSTATTTPIARTTRSPGSTGRWQARRAGAALTAYVARLIATPARASGAAQPGLPARQGASGARHRRHRLVRPGRAEHFSRGVERSGAADVGAAPCHAACPEGKITILTLLLNPTDEQQAIPPAAPHLPARVLLDSAAPEREGRDVQRRRSCRLRLTVRSCCTPIHEQEAE